MNHKPVRPQQGQWGWKATVSFIYLCNLKDKIYKSYWTFKSNWNKHWNVKPNNEHYKNNFLVSLMVFFSVVCFFSFCLYLLYFVLCGSCYLRSCAVGVWTGQNVNTISPFIEETLFRTIKYSTIWHSEQNVTEIQLTLICEPHIFL